MAFQGKDGYSMFKSCPRMFDTETAQVLSTVVMNHFESIKILQGRKKCVSGHRMSLIMTTDKSPSLTGDSMVFVSCASFGLTLSLTLLSRWAFWCRRKCEESRLSFILQVKGRHKGLQPQGVQRRPKLRRTEVF